MDTSSQNSIKFIDNGAQIHGLNNFTDTFNLSNQRESEGPYA